MKQKTVKWLLWIVLLLPYIGLCGGYLWHKAAMKEVTDVKVVIISKEDMLLTVTDYQGQEVMRVPIACGLGYGDKREPGDMKTPEGVFKVSQIQEASTWSHDFKDGKGKIEGAYGNTFIRLNTGAHKGIGIHGTHDPESIGSRCTEGCIRLNNEDVDRLVELIGIATTVIIVPSRQDITSDQANVEV